MRHHRALALILTLASAAAHAQYTVGGVAYKGGAPYTGAELTAVAGLQAGQMMATSGLGDAAQHLLDTGLFDEAWTMKPGDLYDATYIVTFIKKNIAQEVFQPYTFGYRAVGDPQTHLVDMTLTFSPVR
jgi:hypothetical protein